MECFERWAVHWRVEGTSFRSICVVGRTKEGIECMAARGKRSWFVLRYPIQRDFLPEPIVLLIILATSTQHQNPKLSLSYNHSHSQTHTARPGGVQGKTHP